SSTVSFNGTTATVTSWSPASIGVTVAASTTGNVVVTVHGQASNGVPFTIPAPTIAAVSPNAGRYGTSLAITGANFGLTQAAGSSAVTFAGVTSTPSSWSDTSVVVPVPSGMPTGTVALTI